jgi:hypothetical protein
MKCFVIPFYLTPPCLSGYRVLTIVEVQRVSSKTLRGLLIFLGDIQNSYVSLGIVTCKSLNMIQIVLNRRGKVQKNYVDG